MATSSEIFDEDIEYLLKNNGQLLLELAGLTTSILNEKQKDLQQCKWTDGESNLDTDFSKLACECAQEAWICVKQHYPILGTITMVAKIPDINCTFSKNEKTIEVPKKKLELKSSKSDSTFGSTLLGLDINQPLIYCRRPKIVDGHYEIRCGQYYTAMRKTDHDLFQDRSPRPKLTFDKLSPSSHMEGIIYSEQKKDGWIEHYAKCAVNRSLPNKVSCAWQDDLTKSILYEAIQNIETMEDLIKLRESVRPTEI